MPLDKILHFSPPVNRTTVPEEEDEAAEMLEHITEKASHLRARDVARMKLDEQAHFPTLRRNGNRRDGGNPVALVAVPVYWRFTGGRPCFADVGDEQESALVKKCEMGPKSSRFFLYAAIPSLSNVRLRPRPSEWRGAQAFAMTTPCFSATGRYSLHDRRHSNAA